MFTNSAIGASHVQHTMVENDGVTSHEINYGRQPLRASWSGSGRDAIDIAMKSFHF